MQIKDSGKRIRMAGMMRDTSADKIKYHLVFDGPMLERWAAHLTAGAKKYSERNWMGAKSEEEHSRFVESAVRHFVQWLRGDKDEDHAAAVFFNINGAEYTAKRLYEERTVAAMLQASPELQDPPERRVGPADRRKCWVVNWPMRRQMRRRSGDKRDYERACK